MRHVHFSPGDLLQRVRDRSHFDVVVALQQCPIFLCGLGFLTRLCRWRPGNAGRQGKGKCHKYEEAFESIWSYETMNIVHAFLLGGAGANTGIAASPAVRSKSALALNGPGWRDSVN